MAKRFKLGDVVSSNMLKAEGVIVGHYKPNAGGQGLVIKTKAEGGLEQLTMLHSDYLKKIAP